MMKTRLKILIILLIAIVAISTVSAASAAADSVDNKDKVYSIESKEKSVKYKITWNANGGKIGTKKIVTTSVNKGAKINKLQKATRSGYTFKGWYTKKTGGTKITVNTKPTKSVTYYAQWEKTKDNKKDPKKDPKKNEWLVGTWIERGYGGTGKPDGIDEYKFTSGGNYSYTLSDDLEKWSVKGVYSVVNDATEIKLTAQESKYSYRLDETHNWKSGVKTPQKRLTVGDLRYEGIYGQGNFFKVK